MKFEVFGKVGCATCESTKDKLTHLLGKTGAPAEMTFIDVNTVEGRAEGAFNDVRKIPTTILRSDAGAAIARWEGRVPPGPEIQAFLGAPKGTTSVA
jgi:hypothetical protein